MQCSQLREVTFSKTSLTPALGIDAIMHVANCQGVMGGGIAYSIRQHFPGAYHAYKEYESSKGLSLGTVSKMDYLVKQRTIYNLHAQEDYDRGQFYRRHLNYEALAVSLEYVARDMKLNRYTKVGVPRLMGCDLAGGDWKIVMAMLEAILIGQDIYVHITDYDPNA